MKCNNENHKDCNILKAIFIPPAIIAGILIFTWVVMALWNAILPQVIGVHTVTFWQAMGMLVLSKILFGGFGGGHNHHKHHNHHTREMRKKWKQMTPEERDAMKKEWHNRCEPLAKSDEL
ncbi:MAG: hypothetical protein WCR42_15250 [bacterium]